MKNECSKPLVRQHQNEFTIPHSNTVYKCQDIKKAKCQQWNQQSNILCLSEHDRERLIQLFILKQKSNKLAKQQCQLEHSHMACYWYTFSAMLDLPTSDNRGLPRGIKLITTVLTTCNMTINNQHISATTMTISNVTFHYLYYHFNKVEVSEWVVSSQQ